MYLDTSLYELLPSFPCTRLLNSKYTTGCQTNILYTQGIIYEISDTTQLNAFLDLPNGEKYVVILSYSLFLPDTIDRMQSSGKLSGIVLVKQDSYTNPSFLSTDSTCPNCQYGLYANESNQHQWNPKGNGMNYKSFDFPIFGLQQHVSKLINQSIGTLNNAISYNKARNYDSSILYAIQFDSFMWAAQNSNACLNQKWCLPIGDYSVWSTYSQSIAKDDNKPIILVSSKWDSNSIIRDFSWGAGTRTGLITAFAIAEALSHSIIPPSNFPKHIIYTLFGAESFGHSGSQRFVNDLLDPKFSCESSSGQASGDCSQFSNISFNNIESIIEIDTAGEIYNPNPSMQYYIHVNEINQKNLNLSSILINSSLIFKNSSVANIGISHAFDVASGSNNKLPPSGIMAFLAKANIPSILISDYKTEFSNPYYNSDLDIGNKWNQTHVISICGIATHISKTLYALANNIDISMVPVEISSNCEKVGEWMDCLTRNISCKLVNDLFLNQAIISDELLQSGYSGIFGSSDRIRSLTFNYFLNQTAVRGSYCNKTSDCDLSNPGFSCVTGVCLKGLTRNHNAVSMGLSKVINSSQWIQTDPYRASWSESTWSKSRMRIYKSATWNYGWMTFGIGIGLSVIFSIGVVLLRVKIKKNYKID